MDKGCDFVVRRTAFHEKIHEIRFLGATASPVSVENKKLKPEAESLECGHTGKKFRTPSKGEGRDSFDS